MGDNLCEIKLVSILIWMQIPVDLNRSISPPACALAELFQA